MERDIVIGKYTLESLTNGMYSEPMDLFREYIQNAVDSIDSAQSIQYDDTLNYHIKIQIDKLSGTIIIRDNGEGIPSEHAVPTLVNIGNSGKDKTITRGFRGIGRLAGLGYCDELIFSTSYKGESEKSIIKYNTCLLRKLLLSKDIVSIDDVLKKIVTVETGTDVEESHYFEVELNGVSAAEKLLDEIAVESYLLQHAPLPYNNNFSWASIIKEKCQMLGFNIPEYHIELNGKTLYKPYNNTFICDRVKKREDSIYDIEVKPFYREDRLVAVLWYAVIGYYGTILDTQIKGIRIRQGNILIGDRNSCNVLFKEERFNGWMIGELHVFDPDMIVNARRDFFEQNEAHYDLSESFKEWSSSKSREIRRISYQRNLSEKKKAVLEADTVDDVNNLFVENFDNYGESKYIDREESEELSEIDFMDKLSWIINKKKGATRYMALNINDRLSSEQKKIVERVFDIISERYKKNEAERFINTIVENI